MASRRISLPALFAFLVAIVFTSTGAPGKKAKPKRTPPTINLQAENIAKAVPKYNPKENKAAAAEQMKQLIHLIANTNRDNLSSNSSLVRTAMDFRKDLGEHQRTISMGAIVKAWDTAYTCGAISNHHFHGKATKGRYSGEELVFENIVPPKELPECKGYIGNLRLVPASLARKQDAPLDKRDKAYAIGLKQVIHESKSLATMLEIQKSKVGHLALTEAQHEERWRAEVAATGDAYKKRPNLNLTGQKMGTPSKMNGYCYKLRVEVINQSSHPTEVEIETTIVGYTENDNEIYEMKRDRRTLRLRRSQVHEYLIKTPNVSVFKKPLIGFDPRKSQKVIYRGFTIVAKFNDEIIDSIGSDARMTRVALGEYSAPPMITGASRSGGTQTAPAPPSSGRDYELVRFASPADLAAGKDAEIMGSAPSDIIGLMADEKRMYRLDSDGTLWIYEKASFNASSKPLGDVFAGRYVHSLFSDGSNYYIHLSQPTADYDDNDVVKFSSVGDLMSGKNGEVMGQAAPGSASFMADGKSYFKAHHGSVQEAVLSSRDLAPIIANTKPNYKSEGKLFCGKNHRGVFSDGTHYYLLVASTQVK